MSQPGTEQEGDGCVVLLAVGVIVALLILFSLLINLFDLARPLTELN